MRNGFSVVVRALVPCESRTQNTVDHAASVEVNLLDDGIDRYLGISELRRRRTRPVHLLIRRFGPIAKRISPATLASASSLSVSFVRFILEFACRLEPSRGAPRQFGQ